MASNLVAPRNLCLSLPGSHGALPATVLRGHLSLSGSTVGSVSHFRALVTRGDHWDKRDAFLSAGDSQYPILWQIG